MKTRFTFLAASLFLASAANAQYCMLAGRTSYAASQPGITNFKLNNINRTSLNVEGAITVPPIVVTTDSTVLARGKTYTVTISHSEDVMGFAGDRNNIRVWIDYNSNFSFLDAGETVISKDGEAPGTTFTGTFTVPANAPLGPTRLRATAKMGIDAGHSFPTPCDDPKDNLGYHGEMEDYKVIIAQFPSEVESVQAQTLEASVYPNPSGGKITVSLNYLGDVPVSIDMCDVTGKKIAGLVKEEKAQASYSIDMNQYAETLGLYILRISAGEAVTYQKVIKANN